MEAHGLEPHRSLGIRSLELYPSWVRQVEALSGSTVGFWPRGLYRLVLPGEDPEALRPDTEASWTEDLPHVLSHARGAWWMPKEASVEAPRLVQAVRVAAERVGVRFVTGRAVRKVTAEGVVLEDGEHLSGRPVVCAGAWTGLVPGASALPVRPVRGQVMEVMGPPGLLESVVFCAGGYLVPRPDGRVVVGATMEEVGFERAVTVSGLSHLVQVLRSGLPHLDQAPVLRTWCNFRPGTPDGLPLMGWVDGIFVAAGHFRNGILLAPLTAEVVADALLNGAKVPEGWRVERVTGDDERIV